MRFWRRRAAEPESLGSILLNTDNFQLFGYHREVSGGSKYALIRDIYVDVHRLMTDESVSRRARKKRLAYIEDTWACRITMIPTNDYGTRVELRNRRGLIPCSRAELHPDGTVVFLDSAINRFIDFYDLALPSVGNNMNLAGHIAHIAAYDVSANALPYLTNAQTKELFAAELREAYNSELRCAPNLFAITYPEHWLAPLAMAA